MIVIQPLSEDSWEVLRETRLRALAESPSVFGSSLDRERGFKESHWRMRLRGSPWWAAVDAGGSSGLVCLIEEPGSPPEERHVVSLWVDPARRRCGTGTALLAAAQAAAGEAGAAAVTTWAVRGNDAVAQLLTSCGWSRTGDAMPLPRDPSQTEERWRVDLTTRAEA